MYNFEQIEKARHFFELFIKKIFEKEKCLCHSFLDRRLYMENPVLDYMKNLVWLL